MEVGGVQNTMTGILDKQKELDAKVKAVKNSVTVSIVWIPAVFEVVLIRIINVKVFRV